MLSSFSCTAQNPNFLADKHVQQKISCESCHGVNNSTGEERCIYCHGNMDKIGEKSQGKFTVNPHAPHGAHVSCLRCHKGHKEDENYCNKCHDFNFSKK